MQNGTVTNGTVTNGDSMVNGHSKVNGHATTATLPSSDSSHLKLIPASREQIVRQLHSNSVEWRGALPLEKYLKREDFLADQDLTRDGGITFWVLVDGSLPEKEQVVLSGCETIRKRAVVSRTREDGQVHVEDVICHGVCSVFCPIEFRGRGYAGRMIADLAKILKTWQNGEAGLKVEFSVLFSDIGKKFYARHGWEPFPSSHVHVPAGPSNTEDNTTRTATPRIKLLHASDLPELCKADEKHVRAKLGKPARDGSHSTRVAILPNVEHMRWHHAREEFVAREFLGRTPEVKGALVQAGQHRVWGIWTRMWYNEDLNSNKGNTLHLLRISIESDAAAAVSSDASAQQSDNKEAEVQAIAAILHEAQRQAREWNMEHVELWNPDPRALEAAKQIVPSLDIVHREKSSIASLKWYGADSADGLVWTENEKYEWC